MDIAYLKELERKARYSNAGKPDHALVVAEFRAMFFNEAKNLITAAEERADPRNRICNCPLPYRSIMPETHEESCPVVAVSDDDIEMFDRALRRSSEFLYHPQTLIETKECESLRAANEKLRTFLKTKDWAMGVLFKRLDEAGIAYGDLIP